MQRPEDSHEKDDRFVDEGTADRSVRVPSRSLSERKKHPKRSGGLAPDAKRYNDDIPDPDDEVSLPETP
jgi:hypothetical protein